MDWTVDENTAKTLLHQYSEWLDEEHVRWDDDADPRTHTDLVEEFLATRSLLARPKLLSA